MSFESQFLIVSKNNYIYHYQKNNIHDKLLKTVRCIDDKIFQINYLYLTFVLNVLNRHHVMNLYIQRFPTMPMF